MRALVVEHAEHEGAGLVGEALEGGGLRLEIVRTWAGDPLPTGDGAGYELVLVLGGPMSANEAALDGEAALLAASTRAGRPTVGICLGAQLLARGLGARVRRGDAPEIGIFPLTLSDAGRGDPLLAGLDGAPMFQWHSDTFELPAGAALLASSARYAHQAFRVGARTVGVQFHPECSRAMRIDWATRGADELRAAGVDPAALAGDEAIDARGRAFGRALLQLVGVRE
jgi:GMP synthase (glutamine-hydrolysing)